MIQAELDKLFDGDLESVAVVFAEDNPDADSYCLIRCGDYYRHVSEIEGCPFIRSVLPSAAEPQFLSDDDVASFLCEPEPEPVPALRYGDIVTVLDGYMEGLHGIVVDDRLSADLYRVWFRFNTAVVTEVLVGESLAYRKSLFELRRFPVPSVGERDSTGRIPVGVISSRALPSYISVARKSRDSF